MKITVNRQDINDMISYARSKLPNEACGLIAGTEDEHGKTVSRIYYLTNVDESNEHFSLDPGEQLRAVKDMRANGLKPLGNWHSHPESPSRPSEEDKRLAYDPRASYMILSLMEEAPVLKSFHIEKGESTQEELVIRENQETHCSAEAGRTERCMAEI